ncbi:PREDICTED: uncharacterized PKHD-type hydroxylase At1g22950 isoform X2 [Tarenaya hassleriana]|nr:PREDICTED: uncharacterized PKHD-type hydroxylase At1g22950 isoform X2 [Tarenaya hassleriana]
MCNHRMALEYQAKQSEQQPRADDGSHKLRRHPNVELEPDNYDDLHLEFSPMLFSSLERYLPDSFLGCSRLQKACFMRDLLLRYSSDSDRIRLQRHREYRQNILASYQRLHGEIYALDPTSFFLPSFLRAMNRKTEQSYRSIMVEPSPGIFTFEMLQPRFCELLLAEVENFERWVHESRATIMRPNTMNKFGVVLDDFGLENMLAKLVENFINPMSQVLFPEVCGSALDSHHGFIVEYGKDRDVELGFHVDDSEVTLNVCLGRQYSGGELYLRGVRCDDHVNTESREEEIFDYSHVPGHAVLHHGRHRHGARATTAGHRVNLILWCRSSTFRELRHYQRDFSSWCGECRHEKRKKQRLSIDATKQV